MKKINIKLSILISLIVSISLIIIGCNNASNISGNNAAENSLNKEKIKFPINVNITSDSTVTLSLSAGSPGNGNVPVLLVDKNAIAKEISFTLNKFDKDKDAYIFINKKFIDKVQIGSQTEQSVLLKKADLANGTKTIQVVQFEDNDTNKSVIKYNEEKFTIKLK